MNNKSMSFVYIGILTIVFLNNAPSFAREVTKQDVLEHLMDLDQAVNVKTLQKYVPNASQMLCEIASDTHNHWYARHRAASALTEMGDALAFNCLFSLATNQLTEKTLRHLSLYLIGRRFGQEKPDKVIPLLESGLRSKDPDEREYAIRAFTYVPKPQAIRALRQVITRENSKALINIAQYRLRQLESSLLKQSKKTTH